MDIERWQRIETLYHAARERTPETRADFLAAACASDAPLRSEVEKLLAMNDAAGSFLAAPAMQPEGAFLTMETQLGNYQILGQLGAGGMGVVYRARDTRLNRDVAIKVLPADFAQNADRLRRFELEAKATGSLNHPNILTIYDIGTHDGSLYLVAELLEGEELRAQLNNGALPMKRAIEYAQQIAAGLTAAHAKGIVHRDLKPENLFVTKDGRIKILDFGLAKMEPPQNVSAGSDVATLKQLTTPGTVMGTVAYMSPEQVRGEAVDARSDLFSFGLILYEMLTGKRAFEGATMADLMSAILREEAPELSATNPRINPQLEKIVQRCLEKKAEARFQTASDLGFALSTLTMPSGSRLETATALPALTESLPANGKAGWFGNARLWMAVAVTTTLGLMLALPFAVKYLRQALPVEAVAGRFLIAAPEKATRLISPEISPDGRTMVFSATVDGQQHLWVRPLNSLMAQILPGTEGISNAHFWSPDSRSICFPGRDGKLKRVDLSGGVAQTLCSLDEPGKAAGGGTWNRDGVILFTDSGRIYRVPATGGERVLVLGSDRPNQETLYRFPSFLPDGRHFLFIRIPKEGAAEIHLASLDSKETTRLLTADSQAHYAASAVGATGNGTLLFVRAGALLAQPFDASSLKVTGEPFVVADKVTVNNNYRGMFSVSGNGTLVFNMSEDFNNRRLTWVDRAGKTLDSVGTPGDVGRLSLSPDGKRVARALTDTQTKTRDIYVIDLERGVSSRLTFDPADDDFPVWSPDGNRIAWASNRGGVSQINQKLASGVGPEELLLKADERLNLMPDDWSADGRFLLYTLEGKNTKNDLWVLPMVGERQPSLFFQTPFHEGWGRFSPDGRWLAYQTSDQGRPEVNVQPFPVTGAKWQISTNGGALVRWRRDGKELFYLSADNKLMAVEVKSGSSFEAGLPKVLFDLTALRLDGGMNNRGYDVSADGQRFLFVTLGQETANLQYTVVVNWAAEAKK